MPLLPIEFAPCALAGLEDLLAYFDEQDGSDTGKRIAGELIEATRAPTRHPEMRRIVPEFATPSLMELIRPPYRIVYRLGHQHIAVVHIWRSERMPDVPGQG